MKKMIGFMTLAAVVTVSGCGGDSDSSGAQYHYKNSTFTKILPNKNKYACPTEDSKESCITDSTCMAADCKLVDEVVPVAKPNNMKACVKRGKYIDGLANGSCQFKDDLYNADMTVTCVGTKLILDGKIGNYQAANKLFQSGHTNANTFFIKCPT